jgi:hypothetical protein
LGISENQSQEFNITATDIESGARLNCTWYLDGALAEWGQTEYLYRPNYTAAGKHIVTVSVSDGELAATRSWNVSVENVNLDPYNLRITSPRPGDVFEQGAKVTLEGSAQDPDNDTLRYAWFDGFKSLGEGPTLIVVLPAGSHAVTMQVSDGVAEVTSTAIHLTVIGNAVPQLYSLDPVSGQKFEKGAKIHFKADATDADNDVLSYCWTENGKVLSTTAEFYKYDLPAGTHKIYLSISDGKATTETYIVVEITKPAAGGTGPGLNAVVIAAAALVVIAVVVGVLLVRKRRPGLPATQVAAP